MDHKKLHDELIADPLSRGYATMTDQQVADSMNAVDRIQPVREVQAYKIFEATLKSEYDALSTANKNLYNAIISMGSVDPYGANTVAAFLSMFAAGTTTRANLAALRETTVSRADELGIGYVSPGDVGISKSGEW